MANRPSTGGPSSSPPHLHETIETTALADQPHAAAKSAGKVCCACGKDVAGQKRFKDAQGRYWCYDCGVDDHIRKHPEEGVACAKCEARFSPTKMFEFEGASYCEPCVTKVKAAKKREQQRIAAAAEEARRQALHRKMFAIGAGAAAIAACGFAAWRMLF